MSGTQIQANDLPPAFRAQLDEDRAVCAELVTLLLNRPATNPPSIRQLHEAYDVWLVFNERKQKHFQLFKKRNQSIQPEAIALSFGAVMGDHIIAATRSLEWKLVTDSYGTSVALFAAGLKGYYTDIINDPQGMVMKRIMANTSGWLEPTYNATVDQIMKWTGTQA